ncbi:hypothetical protein [Streptomyces sp. NPDC020742]|uniref:hypothetical protein n=1 Tax=Streptomyces sp. NPDC020742 TaxID=3154897 RepID=UPI0033E0CE92
MSTDLYGVRVLDVAPDRRRVTFEIFVVYYDTESRTCAPLPDEPGFFLHLLWERARWDGPLGELITVDRILDQDWVDSHARWFIDDVERISCDNYPPTEDHFARLHDFYYERAGGWQDEDLLVQGQYTVHVTDPRWTQPLRPGDSWGTAAYPGAADRLRREEAPRVPDLRHRTATLTPFEGLSEEAGTPGDLAFSDDGRYLAVTSERDGVVVYDTADWTEHTRTSSGLGLFPGLMWVPGEHVVALNERFGGAARWAYDVAGGAPVDIPRSRAAPVRAPGGTAWSTGTATGSNASTPLPSTARTRTPAQARTRVRRLRSSSPSAWRSPRTSPGCSSAAWARRSSWWTCRPAGSWTPSPTPGNGRRDWQ